MRNWRVWLAAICVVTSVTVNAQITKILIAAGTPEDQAIQEITNQSDAQKRLGLWQDFVQKFATNPDAVAYGNWQLAQLQSEMGDNAKALEFGDKALAARPNDLDIIVSLTSIAQQMKDNTKAMQYACRGGKLYSSLETQKKPEGMSDQDFATRIATEKSTAQQNYEFVETTAYNVISGEQDPKLRLGYIEQYTDAFPESRFAEQVNAYAIMSVQQMNDPSKLDEFAEKALQRNPNSLSTLVLLANAYAEDQNPASAAKAAKYAGQAIELDKAADPATAEKRKLSIGVAHSALGYALLKENKTAQAIVELKAAAGMLKSNPAAYSTVLYRLGFAHAKANQLAEAKEVLSEAVKVEGPFQQASKDLLQTVNSARARRRR